jgi:hypothetical protein
MLRPWEREKLEKMRRESEPERPVLRVPAPERRPEPNMEDPEQTTPARGVAILDFTL